MWVFNKTDYRGFFLEKKFQDEICYSVFSEITAALSLRNTSIQILLSRSVKYRNVSFTVPMIIQPNLLITSL